MSDITFFVPSVLQGGVEKIQELRTSRPLYQAHQEAYALLEATCLSSFYHSYQVFIHNIAIFIDCEYFSVQNFDTWPVYLQLYQLLCGSQLEDLNVKELDQTQYVLTNHY